MVFIFNAGHPVGKVLLVLGPLIPVAMMAAAILLIMRTEYAVEGIGSTAMFSPARPAPPSCVPATPSPCN